MKPKYTRFLRNAFPALIFLPAMAHLASAAVILPDANGDVTITAANSGNNNVLVPNAQPLGQHTIFFNPGTNLTPTVPPATAISILVEQASGASYLVDNNAGAAITGATGFDGISTTGAVTPPELVVQNNGAIFGGNNGIITSGVLDLTNGSLGNITGNLGTGVTALGDISIIENHGLIESQSVAAILLGNNSFVINRDLGEVLGTTDGISAGNNVDITNGTGKIVGLNGNGITALNGATVDNQAGSSIAGNVNGVFVGNTLTLFNRGIISGFTGNGVSAGDDANVQNFAGAIIEGETNALLVSGAGVIDNSGSIIGTIDGLEFLAGTGGILNNTGFISGANAILGAAGDETYNLNLGSRIRGNIDGFGGTDAIVFGPGLSTPGGIGNSVSGNVTTIDTITKNGGGVALIGLPGEGPFIVNSPTILVNGGGLYINGNINAGLAPADFTTNGIAIGGTGTWNANVTINTGGISAGSIPINLDLLPANSVGQVNITGNVDHTPVSFIRFDVNPNTPIVNGVNSDQIVHTGGTYQLDGANVRIASTNNNQVIRDGEYTIVDSGAPITGGFGALSGQLNPNVNAADTGFVGSEIDTMATAVTNNSNTVLANNFSTLSLSPDTTDLLLAVQHNFAGLATNPNGAAFGAALDASVNSPDAMDQDFIAALDNSNLGAVQATLAGASPDAFISITSGLASENYRLHTLVRDHLAMTRSGGETFIEVPATTDAKGGMIPAQTSSSGVSRGNVWGTFSYDWRDNDGFGGNDPSGETGSFTAGVDFRVAPNFLLGILLDGSSGDYDFTGGSSDVESFRAAIYGTYGQSTGLYADFLVGYGSHDIDLTRNAGILGALTSSSEADSLQAMLTVGYAMQAGSVKHGPWGGLEYQNIEVDGYRQGGGFPLAVSGYDVDSFRLLAGYRVEAEYGRFSPYASVAYAHEFEDDGINTRATLPGGAGFAVNGGGLESAILISVGTGYAITDNLGLNVGYRGEIAVGGDGTDSHGGSIGLNYSF